MEKYVLQNGLTIVFEKRPTKTVAVEVTVKTGSNNETRKISGISHFMEHMLFEGTKKRKSSREIATEIERLGGELNAYTSNERTAFYAKVLNRHFDKALEVLSDIIANPLFEEEAIEKERKVILKEIDMVTDEPRFHQWVLFSKTLFKKHPARNPTYGSRSSVKKLARKDLINYFKKHYKPNNMVISVVGNVRNVKGKVSKYFGCLKKSRLEKQPEIREPQQALSIKKEKRKLMSSYMILGYKTPSRAHKDSYVLDIITSVLGRGQSGRMFDEIRNKRGLAYEVGVQHEPQARYGTFAVYLNTHKKNISKAIGIILNEFEKLKKIKSRELQEAKTQIEGSHALENEDNFHAADELAFWEIVKDASLAKNYIREIKKVTKKDIAVVVDKFLNKNYALAVIEQK
jgi:predicted Zn-dependent peptidase